MQHPPARSEAGAGALHGQEQICRKVSPSGITQRVRSHGSVNMLSLAALIAVALLALVLLTGMEGLFNPLPQDLIDSRARAYGIRTFERLTAADSVLRLTSADIEEHGAAASTSVPSVAARWKPWPAAGR